jgi:hypothetical protein
MSKRSWNKWSIRASELGISVSRIMLFTSARELRTYVCWLLYASEGSERAGRIAVMKRVKIS